jgi:spermidine/putrescine transport system ATP-binding protein
MSYGVAFESVTKRFGDFAAVDDITFVVPEGSFFSLLGPSGCGKSTTLRMVSGFEDPDQGVIRIGDDVVNGTPPYRRPTNMVFQRWALFPHMTVFDNVAFGPSVARSRGAALRSRVAEALELVGLSGFADRKPRQLSGGQMQRVALARALINRPKVLLLDEPLGALDLKLRLQMQIELKHIQESVGTTFVYVTHDQGEALTMSDQIAIMRNGRIEQIAAPHEVYDAPATRFVASFVGNVNFLPVEVRGVSGESARVAIGPQEFSVKVGVDPQQARGEIALRYEQIRIGDGAAAQPVHLPARVRDVVFSGSAVHYVVEIDGGQRLTVETPHVPDELPLARDTTVEIGWRGSAVRLYPAEP